mmetsp:Transcript_21332/g.51703  ORF Transcript_21332/g.51703 Transcript_21332/m.51703 type:complete len:218 (-) Transcript_21332:215-868(-)
MQCLLLAAAVCLLAKAAHPSPRDVALEVSASGLLQGATPELPVAGPVLSRSSIPGASLGSTKDSDIPQSVAASLVSLAVFSDGSSLPDTDSSAPEGIPAHGELQTNAEPAIPVREDHGTRPSRISKEKPWHTGPAAEVSDGAGHLGRRGVPLAILLVALVLFLCGSACVMVQLGSQLVEWLVSSKVPTSTNEEAWAILAAEGAKLAAGPPLSRMPGD